MTKTRQTSQILKRLSECDTREEMAGEIDEIVRQLKEDALGGIEEDEG